MPPRYSDPADGIHLARVVVLFGCPCFTILTAAWSYLWAKEYIGGVVFVLLMLLNVPVTVAGIVAIHRSVGSLAVGIVHTVYAVGDIPPPPTYPRQDVMIARGRYADAAEAFRDHIRIEPADNEARLQLAYLLETRLRGFAEAASLYQDVRRLQADPRHEIRAANGLIDLYRRTGQRDRLKIELARFADRYRGAAGHAAARELRQLKEDDATSESPRSPT